MSTPEVSLTTGGNPLQGVDEHPDPRRRTASGNHAQGAPGRSRPRRSRHGPDLCAGDEACGRLPTDVIFTNIHLGLGTDGVACSRGFLDLGIPAVFVTGSREEALAAQNVAVGYLCKPCDPVGVGAAVSVVEKLLAGETPQAEVPGFIVFEEGVERFRERRAGA